MLGREAIGVTLIGDLHLCGLVVGEETREDLGATHEASAVAGYIVRGEKVDRPRLSVARDSDTEPQVVLRLWMSEVKESHPLLTAMDFEALRGGTYLSYLRVTILQELVARVFLSTDRHGL